MSKFDNVPAKAMRFDGASIEVGSNGENAKTAPVKLLARSAKPIDHWYWGRVVHDMAGMTLSKPKLPIDYCHFADEVLGYANKMETSPEGLTMSGALTPFKADDRASEIIFKSNAGEGVPYEASINFAGDGTVYEEVPTGFSTQVNGYLFEGPGIVIRKWTLRGVAICPYGADQNTNALLSDAGSKTFSLTPFKPENTMDPKKLTDGGTAAPATPSTETKPATPAAEVKPTVEAADQPKSDDKPAEGAPATPAPVEAAELTPKPAKGVDGARPFIAAFGNEGAVWFCEGLSFEDAAAKFKASKDAEITALNAKLEAAKVLSGNAPLAPRTDGDNASGKDKKPDAKLTQVVGSEGLATFASSIKFQGAPAKPVAK